MASVVHKLSAVEFPGASPVVLVVITLGTLPKHINRHKPQLAKTPCFKFALYQLQGAVYLAKFSGRVNLSMVALRPVRIS